MTPHLLALIGSVGLFATFLLTLWLCRLFFQIGNGRFLHFRVFFVLQAITYGSAVVSLLTSLPALLLVARFLTPLSYLYLVWGMSRSGDEPLRE